MDKIILTTQSERKKYQEIFGVDEAMFGFAKCGAIEYQPEEFDDNELKKKNYLFSTGRSNRDYSFLMQAIEGTEYQLIAVMFSDIRCCFLSWDRTVYANDDRNIYVLRQLFFDCFVGSYTCLMVYSR